MIVDVRTAARLASIAALLLAPARACTMVQDSQVWTQLNAIIPLTSRFRLTVEQIARFSDRQDGLYQTQWGGLLGYRVNKTFEFGFGYRRVGAHNDNKSPDEDQLRQQVVATAGQLTARFRVDERFSPKGDEIGFRLRPLVRYIQPLGGKGVALYVSHESFFLPNATSWGQKKGYDRMRNAAGITFPISKAVNGDVGYTNQYIIGHGSSPGEMDHILNLQLTINFGAFTAPLLHD